MHNIELSIDELVPYDGVPMKKIDTVPISLVVIIFLLAAAGIVFTIICLIFNFVFSNKRYVMHDSLSFSPLLYPPLPPF